MRGQRAATARRIDREGRERDERDPVAEMTDNALWSAIYRLQSRRNPRLAIRIRELDDERRRRLQ